jgi:hypothetical protein
VEEDEQRRVGAVLACQSTSTKSPSGVVQRSRRKTGAAPSKRRLKSTGQIVCTWPPGRPARRAEIVSSNQRSVHAASRRSFRELSLRRRRAVQFRALTACLDSFDS